MISFKEYIIREGKFKDSNKIIKLGDYPMFTVYIKKGDNISSDIMSYKKYEKFMKEVFTISRDEIYKMGFSKMHSNVLFDETPGDYGKAQGRTDTKIGSKKLKTILLNKKFLRTDLSGRTGYNWDQLVPTIVHEWAHLWMFNNGKEFRDAVKQYHEALVHSNIDKIPLNTANPFTTMQLFYDRVLHQIQNQYIKKQNIKISNIQDNIHNILLDVLGKFGNWAYLIDNEIIKKYSNTIGKIIYNSLNDPYSIGPQIKALNLEKVFGDIVKYGTQDQISKNESVRKKLSDMVKYTGAYGLKNPDETWATALEKFQELDPYHRKRIFELMQINEPRQLPNKRMQKHNKAKQTEFLKNVSLDDLK